ncbi:hypothetical protein PoB_006681000 [Plakobranchus ocellatus]|uniref:Uncharacterized protein n=1 Tax=Plakobranchus ocellatus TaxID=259542 RepID=A0AAV4D8K6_9GAST|nr:hypothetical protein PoB_006681000 [Plakobranchus ocellatus]
MKVLKKKGGNGWKSPVSFVLPTLYTSIPLFSPYQFRLSPLALRPDGGLESLRSACCDLAAHINQTKPNQSDTNYSPDGVKTFDFCARWEAKAARKAMANYLRIPYAKNNQDPVLDSPMLATSVGPILLYSSSTN